MRPPPVGNADELAHQIVMMVPKLHEHAPGQLRGA
jgi:hypothetical protein